MIKAICTLAALALACGAPADEDLDLFPSDGGSELGSAEQAYTAPKTLTLQYGTQTGSAHMQCNTTSSGQVCAVPRVTRYQVCLSNPSSFSAAERNDINNERQFYDALSTSVTIFGGNIACSDLSLQPDTIRIIFSAGSVSGNQSNNIDGYSGVFLSSLTNMTEGQGGGSVTGSYQHFGGCAVTIDRSDIIAKSTALGRGGSGNLFRHAVKHGYLVCLGLGSRTDSGANGFASQRAIDQSSAPSELARLTSDEKCRLDGRGDLADIADFSRSGTCLQ